ncbi:hypothetical protein I4U23_003223 [Adineta vaga]|nr:hypothetical protein I4U23_003223 [Adineta vaga]
MSSPPNIGSVDLESVLNVRRRTLISIGEAGFIPNQHRQADTVYVKREDNSNTLLSIQSRIIIFGELQLLCSTFERYTSNITVYDDSPDSNSNPSSFSTTFDDIDEDSQDTSALTSTLRQTSISSQSSSPPKASGSPPRRKKLSSIGRSQTVTSTASTYSSQNLEGKRYGAIEIGNMNIIEILEVLLRIGLEIVSETSDYDKENVLHQNFILSKCRQTVQKPIQSLNNYGRSSSMVGT